MKKRDTSSSRVISLAGMCGVLALADGLDILVEFLRLNYTQTFPLTPLVLIYSAADLILVVCLLGLFRYVNFRARPSRLVSLILLLVGLAPVLVTAAAYSYPALSSLPLQSLGVVIEPVTKRWLSIAVAAVAATGLFGLVGLRES